MWKIQELPLPFPALVFLLHGFQGICIELVTLPLICEVLEDSALNSEMLQTLDTPKSSEQYEMFINWEMQISYAEMECRE